MSQKVKNFYGPSQFEQEEAKDEDEVSSSSEESDAGDDEQGHANAEKSLHDVFSRIILEVKHADKKKSNLKELIGEQLDQNAEKLTKLTAQGKTILHIAVDIASKDTTDFSKVKPRISNLKPLISELLRRHPMLASKTDSDTRTALHYAIKSQVAKVVDIIADELGDKFEEVLRIEDNTRNNGLHTALKGPNLKKKIPLSLIKRVKSEETFLAPNMEELTPMHIAVEYDRCSANQIEIIDEMIKCWDIPHKNAALDVNVLSDGCEDGEKKRSVFRHHQLTREKEKEPPKEIPTERSKSKLKAMINNTQVEKASKDLPKEKPPGDLVPHHSVPQAPSQPNKPSLLRSGPKDNPKPQATSKPEHIQGIGIVRKPTLLEMDAEKHEGPKADPDISKSHGQKGPLETKKNKPEPANNKPEPKSGKMTQEEAADIIREKLKMHYMCTRDDHSQILSFLYGPKEVKQISLSFVGGPTVIQEARLMKMTYVKFDQTLHSLELPNVEVRMSRSSNASPDEECEGRRDYEAIFQWLRTNSVKQIIHLFVEDYSPCSHSDESIELALRELKVIKTWDWCKLDIDSTTLLKAAPDVQEIVLYWSGRNAVLRGWSEPEGLHKLANLRKITIHGTPGLETSKKALANLDEFKKRMEQLRGKAADEPNDPVHTQLAEAERDSIFASTIDSKPPRIQVEYGLRKYPPGIVGESDSMRSAQIHPPEEQRWISCVKRFNKYARDLLHVVKKGDRKPKPITIALIDDGVDFADERIQSMVEDGRSYYQRQNKLIAPYWTSSGGHGTAMAGLIHTMCPSAKLFVLRLNEYTSINGKRQIFADSAARAVRDAIAKEVDIISMSWTIDSDGNDPGIDRLKKALVDADNKSILLFCAAQDQGVKLDTSFPGEIPACFKIGAATSWGTAHKSTGAFANPIDYIFPGHNVAQDSSGSQRADRTPLLSGSSVATAFAAGLTALILRCVQCAAQYYKEDNQDEDAQTMDTHLKALKKRARMQQAFEAIGEVRTDNTKYVMVWNVFEHIGTHSKDDDPMEKRKWITKLAKKLAHERELS